MIDIKELHSWVRAKVANGDDEIGIRIQSAALLKILDRLERFEEALNQIARGTHEEHPTCITIETGFEFGPPRTGGWEGWAREIRSENMKIARAALGGEK
jgi:hypothetical protein